MTVTFIVLQILLFLIPICWVFFHLGFVRGRTLGYKEAESLIRLHQIALGIHEKTGSSK